MRALSLIALSALAVPALAEDAEKEEFGAYACQPYSSVGYEMSSENEGWKPTIFDVAEDPPFKVRPTNPEMDIVDSELGLYVLGFDTALAACSKHIDMFFGTIVTCATSDGDMRFQMGLRTLAFTFQNAGTFVTNRILDGGFPAGPTVTIGLCEKIEE